MAEKCNGLDLDIGRLGWGYAPTPLLPAALRAAWRDEALPAWLIEESGLQESATMAALDPAYWQYLPTASSRVRHFVRFLVKSRILAISEIRCFRDAWPRGLHLTEIPFSARSQNLLEKSGLASSPESLMRATFGELLRVQGLGVGSLIEITTMTEAAVSIYEQLAGDLSSHAEVTSGHSNEVASSAGAIWRQEFARALQEPWADQINPADPRFTDLFPLPEGTLAEQIERITSDPAAAARDAPALISRLAEIRAIAEQINAQPLEDALLGILQAIVGSNQTRVALIAARLGWSGDDPKTLQECGDFVGITRERVRQLEQRVIDRLPAEAIFLPGLDDALTVLEAAAPMPLRDAAILLRDRGITREPFSPIALLKAAQLLSRDNTLSIGSIKGQRFLVSASKEKVLGVIARVARSLAGQSGVSSVFQVVDRLRDDVEANSGSTSFGQEVSEQEVRQILAGCRQCDFLNDDWFWFVDIPEGRNRLANISKRILSVASPQSVSDMREGVRRAFHYRSSSAARYRSLRVPPQSVMASFYGHHPDFDIRGNVVSATKQLDLRAWLGEGEQVLVDVIRSSASGVLDRRTLIAACKSRGLNENTLSVYTTYSPVVEHIGLDLWKLRGVKVDPAAVQAVREQNQLRPREKRLREYGWTSDGKLWVAWVLPESMNSLVCGIPGSVRRYLAGRSFRLLEKASGRHIGEICVNDAGSSYGYGPYLRYAGADEGDILVAEFDLASADVRLSIADDDLFEHN